MNRETESTIRVRYAPSPTGLLHVGNLRTGLFAWLFARQRRGAFILRIEDTDRARSQRRFEEQIYRDLKWFGMDWDEGPDVGGRYGPYRQSERGQIYLDRARELLGSRKAFRCFCSEEDLAAAQGASPSRQYPGTCRTLPAERVASKMEAGEAFVVRLAVREGDVEFDDIVHGPTRFSTDVISDPILLRSDSTPTYNYAVAVDDASMRVSHVIRGDDHLSNTPKQILIYEALDASCPRFAHLSTVLGPDQTKLSKRHGATAVAEFRDAGYLPEALMNYIALLGWSPGAEGREVVPRDRLVSEFDLHKVNKNPAVFDFGKLNFLNRHYLRESSETPVLVTEALDKIGYLPRAVGGKDDPRTAEWVGKVLETLIGGIDVVPQIGDALREVLSFSLESEQSLADCGDVASDPGALDMIRLFQEALESSGSLTNESFRSIVSELKKKTGRKGRELFHPLRVALTGRSSGPELDKLIPLVETASRLGVAGVTDCRGRVGLFLDRYGS